MPVEQTVTVTRRFGRGTSILAEFGSKGFSALGIGKTGAANQKLACSGCHKTAQKTGVMSGSPERLFQ
jgi:hypothetical protein